jgi:protein TonB
MRICCENLLNVSLARFIKIKQEKSGILSCRSSGNKFPEPVSNKWMENVPFVVWHRFLWQVPAPRRHRKREEVMLDQLVVSSGHRRESRKFRAFFLGTAVVVLVGCFSVFVWSIMAAELTLTDDGLELSAMIAPVPIPAVEPPKPEPPQAASKPQQQAVKDELPSRQVNMMRLDESQEPPKNISTTPNTQKARPATPFTMGKIDTEGTSTSTAPTKGDGSGGGDNNFFNPGGTIAKSGDGDGDKPPVMPKKDPEQPRRTVPVSGGVLNGKARSLPVPPYPKPAQIMNIRDNVSVQVVIDEQGNVISAKAVSGHQMLRQAAEQAARLAKFGPTLLTGQPVKVTGVIIYKFSNG